MRQTILGVVRVVLYSLLVLTVGSGVAMAQYRAGIQGVVTDPSGAVVVGATITLTNLATNLVASTTADDKGIYVFSGLGPGHYSLDVESPGFKKKVYDDVQIVAEKVSALNVSLDLGQATQSVSVTATVSPIIDRETAQISGTLTSKEIQSLPVFSRDAYQVLRLAPGVFGDGSYGNCGGSQSLPGSVGPGGSGTGGGIYAVENGVQIVANGARNNSNGFQIDGVQVNSAAWGGAAVITPNLESVDEVTVVANSYSAENGHSSGAQVQVVSKSGTNQLHGSAFFKIHRPGLNAFQAFNGPGTPSPVIRESNRFNLFGGSVGGPIKKDKLFGFFSYETERNDTVVPTMGWYETSSFLQNAGPNGSLARRTLGFPGEGPAPGTVIGFTCKDAGLPSTQCQDAPGGLDLGSPLTTPLGTADPTFGQKATPFGIGNGFDGVADEQLLLAQNPTNDTDSQYNGRVDYQATDKDRITGSVYFVPVRNHFLNGPARPANLWNHNSIAESWTGIYTRAISATLENEARFGLSGWYWNEINTNPQEPFGLPTDNISPIGGTVMPNSFGAPGPSIFNQKSINVRDTLTKVKGSHFLKFGADITRIHFLDVAPWAARATYNFRNLWDFANDAPFNETANFDPVTGRPTEAQKNLRSSILAGFVQDDWKFRPNLTLNLGLRWEDFTPLTERDGLLSNPIPGPNGAVLTGATIKKGGDLYNNQLTNFEPQLGFAWSPSRTGSKLVLRGGFGVSHNAEQLAISTNGRFNPPFLTNLNLFGSNILYAVPADVHQLLNWPSNPVAITQFDPTTGLPTTGAPVSLTGISTDFPIPVTYRYSVDGQYDFGHDWVASLGYQGSQTRHYGLQTFLDRFYFGSQANPRIQNFDLFTNDANAHHNALLAEVSHRFASSFELDVQYELSRSIDDGSHDYYVDNYLWNRQFAIGPSDFDATHNFKVWGVWTPPFFKNSQPWVQKVAGGWTISSIITAHSGFPFSPQYCNTGGNVAYPNSGDSCLDPGSYLGGAGTNYSNATFEQENGNFPKGALSYFTVPTFPALGIPPPPTNFHRNMFRGPGFVGDDATLAKAFGLPTTRVLGEGAKLNLEADFYNMFNKVNLINVNNIISNDGVTSNSAFGQAQNALGGRIIELQLRLSF